MTPDIIVLSFNIHGMSVDDYAVEFAERLPASWEVVIPRTAAERREMLPFACVVAGLKFTEDRNKRLRTWSCSSAYSRRPTTSQSRHFRSETSPSPRPRRPRAQRRRSRHRHGPLVRPRARPDARTGERCEWRHFQVGELQGSTATVVGLGPIGTAITERLNTFGVETIGVRYTPAKGGPTDEVIGYDTAAFHEALARTDHLILACPLTDVTRPLVGDGEFATCRPAFIVNVAHGEVVDTDALVEAVRGHDIDSETLDVTDPEPLPEIHVLWNFDDVLVTPHNAGHTPRYWD